MPKTYKILLSAYACEPNRGSEPGVGWHWALEIAKKGHQVWVLTRANNKDIIEDYFSKNIQPINLQFIYYDLPKHLLKLKKRILGVNVYYLLWQFGVLSKIKEKHKYLKFDFVHHITFGVFRHPSLLYKLKIPCFFGPVGGGEQTPSLLKVSFPLKYKLIELLRELSNCFSSVNPILFLFFKKCSLVFTKTEETKQLIPFKNKIINLLEIGVENIETFQKIEYLEFNILYAGRIVYWKGIDLIISSFNKYLQMSNNEGKLTFIGDGKYCKYLNSKILNFNICNSVNLINWISQNELKYHYQNSHVMLFPSLHDSSGNVVLEALSNGLPVICLDIGGPCQIVNETCGRVISTKNRNEEQVVDALSAAIIELKNNPELRKRLSEGAIKRASEFTWEKTVDRVYSEIEKYMDNVNKTN